MSGVIGTNVTGVFENSATSGLLLSGVNTFTYNGASTFGLNIQAGTVTASTSASALGAGQVTLGNTTGTSAATLLVNTTGLTYANPILLAANATAGTLAVGNTGTAISTTFSGGVTGTNSFTINENATSGTITFATGTINNAGGITNAGAGTGTTTISAAVGANVTGITESSSTSALTVSGALTTAGTTFSSSGNALFTVSSPTITGTGNLVFNANSTGLFTVSAASINNIGTVTNSGSGAGATTVSGVIGTNVTSVVENSPNSSLTLTGANTYSGTTLITAGTMVDGANANAVFGTSTITLGDNNPDANSATLNYTANAGATANNIILGSGSTGTLTIGIPGGSVGAVLSGNITGTNNLTVNNS